MERIDGGNEPVEDFEPNVAVLLLDSQGHSCFVNSGSRQRWADGWGAGNGKKSGKGVNASHESG